MKNISCGKMYQANLWCMQPRATKRVGFSGVLRSRMAHAGPFAEVLPANDHSLLSSADLILRVWLIRPCRQKVVSAAWPH
ncbi:hypothetical protein M406DRAFT_101563 [Cryphonectria parasitica EP155]|uniref:Uncharacterized protein n=1 Tax=Cryphonectria parasitica (strain ATCC 38755 / EP155) TaxID=660469 RepID=A0A9P4Y3M9_CRYP1|nr:uncharacterized protein M406DRAFT_101563 [Cryphonectria parasitica EP155]KAF3766093.1 hypothetical protein M406DRAFT_101563 [Cryphonectria parasitica EP155]